MVEEAREQADAQAVAAPAMAVGFLEHPEDLQAADDVFHEDSLAGQSLVMRPLLGGERRLLTPAFVGRAALGVEFG